jgi:hypothetical protein
VKPQDALAPKGDHAVEEWIDLQFFRPLGVRLARRLQPTGVTADQVTLAALLIGLVAGHLFLYHDWRLGVAGFLLFVVSDVFDSADGQLARLRGTSTRFGRILDGVSDSLRFVNLFLHLLVRILRDGAGWQAIVLVLLVTIVASFQAGAVDFMRNAYLRLGGPGRGELDLPEDLTEPPQGFWARLGWQSYAGYVRRQVLFFPGTLRLARWYHEALPSSEEAARYRSAQGRTVASCAWIGQNSRFILLLLTAVPGWPAGYFWVTGLGFTAVLAALIYRYERTSRALGAALLPETEHAYSTP